MDIVLRAAAIYGVILLVLRVSGRRSLRDLTAVDFVLLLVVGEAAQLALLGHGFSLGRALLVVAALAATEALLAALKGRLPPLDRLLPAGGVPTILVEDGRWLRGPMREARVDERTVIEAARRLEGLERLDQIRYAAVEAGGAITIVPK